jgi:glycosyltransferase involved in cell wall biosynthesis/SAM-dependent methyltransferase
LKEKREATGAETRVAGCSTFRYISRSDFEACLLRRHYSFYNMQTGNMVRGQDGVMLQKGMIREGTDEQQRTKDRDEPETPSVAISDGSKDVDMIPRAGGADSPDEGDAPNLVCLYDEGYYKSCCGPIPYERSERWLSFFSRIAEELIRSLRPSRILDAGCAMGFLVEAFWDRGVEAWGIDLSAYAISKVRRDMQPYCRVGSLVNPIEGRYDLLTCIEVLEHIPEEYARAVVQNLCAASDNILFSSTPDDLTESTHVNVRPTIYWLKLFSDFQFWPVLIFDASFVAPHAMLLKKNEQPLPAEALVLFAQALAQRTAAHRRENELHQLRGELAESNRQLAETGAQAEALAESNRQLAETAAQQAEALAESNRQLAETAAQQAEALAESNRRSEEVRQQYRASEKLSQELRQELQVVRHQLDEIRNKPAWRILERYRAWASRQRFAHPQLFGWYEKTALWVLGESSAKPEMADSEPAPKNGSRSVVRSDEASIRKFALIISGCSGDTFRYRCEHQVEELRLLGLTVDTALFDLVVYESVLAQYQVFIMHRVPHNSAVEAFIRRAKAEGKLVVFDSDDLVFNEKVIGFVDAVKDFSKPEYDLYLDGLRRYNKTLSLCSAAIVTTEPLSSAVKELFPQMPIYVNRNAVNDVMVQQAESALRDLSQPADGIVRVAYFSGTRTHAADFRQCVPALQQLLRKRINVHLMIVGHLEVPAELQQFSDRIEVTPLVPWERLPELMRRANINLAPLEPDNRFTECKSELKYFETGLLELPTIASDIPAYRVAITHGRNGFLCNDEKEWFKALEALVGDRELCMQLGSRARQDVLARYTTRSRASQLAEVLRNLIPSSNALLSVAFVMQAPIAQTGGGYKNIFQLGQYLSGQGHEVNFYIEPVSHLAGMSESAIVGFCNRYFGASAIKIHVGHNVLPSDVAIATGWPTAYVVDQLTNTLCKAYLVQDFEPDFYEKTDPSYQGADHTYHLPLKKIALGRYLQKFFSERDRMMVRSIRFALDRSIFCNRKLRPEAPTRILFFARPHIKRRAYPVGVQALRVVARACPDVQIAFYGMSETQDLGFPYENIGELSSERVAEEMNKSHIHLSFSLTNISWTPFEAMACGCAVVEAKVPSVEMWMEEDDDACLLVEPNANAVAEALIKLVKNRELRVRIAENGEQFLSQVSGTWEEIGAEFESILLDAVFKSQTPRGSIHG